MYNVQTKDREEMRQENVSQIDSWMGEKKKTKMKNLRHIFLFGNKKTKKWTYIVLAIYASSIYMLIHSHLHTFRSNRTLLMSNRKLRINRTKIRFDKTNTKMPRLRIGVMYLLSVFFNFKMHENCLPWLKIANFPAKIPTVFNLE